MEAIKAKILSEIPQEEPLLNNIIEDVKEIEQLVDHPKIL